MAIFSTMETTRVLNQGAADVLDVLGPTVEKLVSTSAGVASYCVMKGVIPPGLSVPLHSHPDDESFYLISGGVDVLLQKGTEFEWRAVKPGDFVHVPHDVKHAWRSTSREPSKSIIVTTPRLGQFLMEVGTPVSPDAVPLRPGPEAIERFMRTSARYGHWLGTPEENAAVGITVPPAGSA